MQNPEGDQPNTKNSTRLTGWGWFTLIVLFVLLAVAIWYCIHAWGEVGGSGISPAGWVFLTLGVVVTILVGGGLMALLFYSSREGKDF
ncbi:MAG TPA: hypothetical protein VGK90_06155 [Rhizomicrobium sp.]|jgi:hypothetical protein